MRLEHYFQDELARLRQQGRELADAKMEEAETRLLAEWRERRDRTWRAPMPAPFRPH